MGPQSQNDSSRSPKTRTNPSVVGYIAHLLVPEFQYANGEVMTRFWRCTEIPDSFLVGNGLVSASSRQGAGSEAYSIRRVSPAHCKSDVVAIDDQLGKVREYAGWSSNVTGVRLTLVALFGEP